MSPSPFSMRPAKNSTTFNLKGSTWVNIQGPQRQIRSTFLGFYPLVNVYKKLWKITIFNGKSSFLGFYPLVNVYKKLWKITIFNGKSSFLGFYPLVNVYKKLWKITIFNGKSSFLGFYPLVNVYKKLWKDPPFFMGKYPLFRLGHVQ